MSSTRPRRVAASASSTSLATSSPAVKSTRSRRGAAPPVEQEPSPELAPLPSEEPGPSRSRNAKRGSKVKREITEDAATPDEGSMDDLPSTSTRTRGKKGVSYREIPPEDIPDEEEDEDEDAEGEEDVEGESAFRVRGRRELRVDPTPPPKSPATPSRKRTASQQKTDESPFRHEKIGSGRGGFSVKGAAAAAAHARWAKVRREKAERGEESDDGEKRHRTSRGAKRDARNATADNYTSGSRFPRRLKTVGSQVTIKGQEYTVGDDELNIPDDPKGETKVDAEGHLQGGREYKLVTFTSETRRNPNRVYALTIDAARACGYSDSLAFLRRCPQVLKLACNAQEREMLIEIGRVTGNLKHRMVTMVAMRNIYKLMGARVVKNDYYEDESLTKCAETGFTPYAPATEDDIIANAMSLMQPQGRPPATGADNVASRGNTSMSPWYTLGGPTTHFAGNGADPWSEAGWGHKRAKLRNAGVSEEDWMLRTAEECRVVDARLKEYREERLLPVEGKDTGVWVWAVQQKTEGDSQFQSTEDIDPTLLDPASGGLRPPTMERKRSALSQEVTFAKEEVQTPAIIREEDGDENMRDSPIPLGRAAVDAGERGKIVVQAPKETRRDHTKWNWTGEDWQAGTVYAVYEPHTHMPHVPLHTQPTGATVAKVSSYPVVSSQADGEYKNFVQSTISGQKALGFASVEYVYTPPSPRQMVFDELWGNDDRKRTKEIEEALEWERSSRAKRRAQSAVAA